MLFFLDESGTDHGQSPYEVLGAVAIAESSLWEIIQAIDGLEKLHFGINLRAVNTEIKAQNLLTTKKFRHSRQCELMSRNMRRDLARTLLQQGAIASKTGTPHQPTSEQLAAYAQAAIAFVHDVLNLCAKYHVKAFGAVVPKLAAKYHPNFLRKDYRFLLNRFASYVGGISDNEVGILVFDQIERQRSRRLLDQFMSFCSETQFGYKISAKIIPAPFFVDSQITSAIQIADLVAYILNWGWRGRPKMAEPAREEIAKIYRKLDPLQWSGYSLNKDLLPRKAFRDRGFFYIENLEDKVAVEAFKKLGKVTEWPPPDEGQNENQKKSMPPDGQLPLFDLPSMPEE